MTDEQSSLIYRMTRILTEPRSKEYNVLHAHEFRLLDNVRQAVMIEIEREEKRTQRLYHETKRIEEENNKYNTENQRLSSEIENLKRHIGDIIKENQSLKLESEHLRRVSSERGNLKTANEHLKQQINELIEWSLLLFFVSLRACLGIT
jgi:hypothetical protein